MGERVIRGKWGKGDKKIGERGNGRKGNEGKTGEMALKSVNFTTK